MNAHANRIMNRIENRRRGRDHRLLADSFRAEGPDRRRIFDQDRLDRRNVARRRNQIVVQILAFAGEEFLHQRHAEALRNSALDLAFNQSRIDGAPDIMGRGHLQHTNRAQFNVDFDLRHVRAETEDRVRIALPVFIQRSDRRIECRFAGDDVSMRDRAEAS